MENVRRFLPPAPPPPRPDPPLAGSDFPCLQEALKEDAPIPNPDAAEDFHPPLTHSSFGKTRDDLHALSLFAEDVSAIEEPEEGDCKRQILLALYRLRDNLRGDSPWVSTWIERTERALTIRTLEEDPPDVLKARAVADARKIQAALRARLH